MPTPTGHAMQAELLMGLRRPYKCQDPTLIRGCAERGEGQKLYPCGSKVGTLDAS